MSVGGICVEPGAPTCTHLVVDDRTTRTIPFELNGRVHVVKSEVSCVFFNDHSKCLSTSAFVLSSNFNIFRGFKTFRSTGGQNFCFPVDFAGQVVIVTTVLTLPCSL